MSTFNKYEFQEIITESLRSMVDADEVINDGQLLNFLTYFQHTNPQLTLDLDSLLGDLGFVRSIRMLMVYNTLALTLHEPSVYVAAVEVFPLEDIPAEYASLLLAILEHMQTNPMPIQASLEKDLPDPLKQRLELLKQSLLRRLGDNL